VLPGPVTVVALPTAFTLALKLCLDLSRESSFKQRLTRSGRLCNQQLI